MKYTGKKEEIKYFTDSEEFYDEPVRSKSKNKNSSKPVTGSSYNAEVSRIYKSLGNGSETAVNHQTVQPRKVQSARSDFNDDTGNLGNGRSRSSYRSPNPSRTMQSREPASKKSTKPAVRSTQRINPDSKVSSVKKDNTGSKKKKKKSFVSRLFPKNDPLRMVSFAALFAYIILVVMFIIVVINLDVLTSKIILAAVLALLLFLAFFIFAWRSNTKALRIVGLAVSLLMCIVLAVGSYYVSLSDATLETITTEGFDKKVYNVAVLVDDPAKSISDTDGYKFGVMSLFDGDEFDEAMKELKHRAGDGITTQDYDSLTLLSDALFNKECRAIMFQDGFSPSFEEIDPDFSSKIRIIDTIIIMTKSTSTRTATYQGFDVTTQPFVVYISGSDEWGDDISVTGRSDVNMLAVVNFNTHQVLLTSVPRDYYVLLPGISGNMRDKLTHAGLYGIEASMDALSQCFSVDINYYIRINFSSLISIVDAIGGLDIDNPYAFSLTYEGEDVEGFFYPEGRIHLDGEHALYFARERYSIGGDLARGQHQQMIIEAMINQLVSASSVVHYAAIMDAVDNCAVTNMPSSDIKALVKAQLDKGGSWQILKTQAKGDNYFQPCFSMDGYELAVVVPYAESVGYISGLMDLMMNGDYVPDNYEEMEPENTSYICELVSDSDYYEEEYVEPEPEQPVEENPPEEEYQPEEGGEEEVPPEEGGQEG